jgi:hypothetical protein
MPSTIRGSDNFDTAGGNAVKAWVNFNGTGTVAIRASYNVASITDNGVGQYTVNFTAAMPDANYATVFSPTNGVASYLYAASFILGRTTSSVSLGVTTSAGAGGFTTDISEANVAIFR